MSLKRWWLKRKIKDKKTWKEKGKRQKIKIRGKNEERGDGDEDGDGEDRMEMEKMVMEKMEWKWRWRWRIWNGYDDDGEGVRKKIEKKIWADDDKPWNIKRCQKKRKLHNKISNCFS